MKEHSTAAKWVTGIIIAVGCVVAFLAVVGAFIAMYVGVKTFGRMQDRADRNQNRSQLLKDARNNVTVNSILINTFGQKEKIAQKQADIRYIKSTGVRRAQDEIAKTLTPLYVQFEMISALQAIATSGRNATVVYIPTGSNGLPIVNTTTGKTTAVPGK
jgi:hypothetical protein